MQELLLMGEHMHRRIINTRVIESNDAFEENNGAGWSLASVGAPRPQLHLPD